MSNRFEKGASLVRVALLLGLLALPFLIMVIWAGSWTIAQKNYFQFFGFSSYRELILEDGRVAEVKRGGVVGSSYLVLTIYNPHTRQFQYWITDRTGALGQYISGGPAGFTNVYSSADWRLMAIHEKAVFSRFVDKADMEITLDSVFGSGPAKMPWELLKQNPDTIGAKIIEFANAWSVGNKPKLGSTQ